MTTETNETKPTMWDELPYGVSTLQFSLGQMDDIMDRAAQEQMLVGLFNTISPIIQQHNPGIAFMDARTVGHPEDGRPIAQLTVMKTF